MRWRALALLLVAASVHAQPLKPWPPQYIQCKEVPTPGSLPAAGNQLVYCKQGGAGWCSVNASGIETCTGGAGGGGSFALAGDSGPPQTISGGDTLTVAGGAGIITTAGATDTVTIATASTENNFLTPSLVDLTCGAGTAGRMLVTNQGSLQFCDNTVTPTMQYPPNSPQAATTNGVATWGGTGGRTLQSTSCTISAGGTLGGSCLVPTANGGTRLTTAGDDAVLVGNGTTCVATTVPQCNATGQTLNYNQSGNAISCQAASPVRVDATAGVDCTGTTDSTTGVQNALNALTGTGATLFIPSQCILRLASPAANNAPCLAASNPWPCCSGVGAGTCNGPAITVPNNVHILCADQSAGFAVNHQSCGGHNTTPGTYPGAACRVDADCLGGGTCDDDFGHSGTNPCTSTTCFAPTAGQTYIILADASTQSSDIAIDNCSLFTYQASPYQTCVGNNVGDPCRQECDDNSTPTTIIGKRCETNADCGAGTCLRTADCHGGGAGTCGGVQPTGSNSGPGSIDPLQFSRTIGVKLQRVSIFDHFVGNIGVSTGQRATLIDNNFAREITDCTSPIPSLPVKSICFTTGAGACCYGASNIITSNVQPTTAVTNDVNVGTESQMLRNYARGRTNSFLGAAQTRIDESTVWPPSSAGPGTAAAGFSVGQLGIVAKSFAQFLASGSTGIALTGSDATAIENKLAGAYTTGIQMSGANTHATGNNMKSTTGASTQIGIKVATSINNTDIKTNYIESNATSGTGIQTNGANTTITGNQIISNAVDTLLYGIETLGTKTGHNVVDGNIVSRVTGACFRDGELAGIGTRFNGNVCANLLFNVITGTIRPACLLLDGAFANQVTFGNNYCEGNWRNLVGNSFTNVNITGNRFYLYSGAAIDMGNAGIHVLGNYFNSQNFTTWSSSCDSSCTGGTPSTKGVFCGQDSDCTANGNTCNAAVFKCNPEPIIGYFGNMAEINSPNQHPTWSNNLMFNGFNAVVKQCTVAGAIGQICDVASCAAGASCAGSPSQTCQSGTDAGKRCCQTAAGATCAQRGTMDMIDVPDHGAASRTITNALLLENNIFGGNGNDYIYLNFMPHGASLGNQGIGPMLIMGNNWTIPDVAGNTYIKFPTTVPAAFNVQLANNAFGGPLVNATPISNYQGAFGSINLINGTIQRGTGTGMGAAAVACGPPPGEFFPENGTAAVGVAEAPTVNTMNGAGTIWKMTCTADAPPGGGNTRVYTLRKNGANTTLTCTIAGAAQKECTTAAGAASAPINFASGDTLDWGDCSTGAAIGGVTTTCSVYVSETAM